MTFSKFKLKVENDSVLGEAKIKWTKDLDTADRKKARSSRSGCRIVSMATKYGSVLRDYLSRYSFAEAWQISLDRGQRRIWASILYSKSGCNDLWGGPSCLSQMPWKDAYNSVHRWWAGHQKDSQTPWACGMWKPDRHLRTMFSIIPMNSALTTGQGPEVDSQFPTSDDYLH